MESTITMSLPEFEGAIARGVRMGLEAYNGKKDVKAVSVKEACDMLTVSDRTLYRLISAGHLEVKKVGHRTLITTSSIHRYLNK